MSLSLVLVLERDFSELQVLVPYQYLQKKSDDASSLTAAYNTYYCTSSMVLVLVPGGTGQTSSNLNIFYGVQQATRNGIIYPSLDPMIFEVKFPDNDIKGRIATY